MTNGEIASLLQQLRNILAWLPHLQYRVPILDDSASPRYPDGMAAIGGAPKLGESIKKEIGVIERLLAVEPLPSKPPSINAIYYITLWNAICMAPPPIISVNDAFPATGHQESAKVDVVADGGRRWIRINSTKPSRLSTELNELADSDSEDSGIDDLDGAIPIPLLMKTALLLKCAAACNAYGSDSSCIPKVTLLLSRIHDHDDDHRRLQFFSRLLKTGVDIQYSESLPSLSKAVSLPPVKYPPLRPTRQIAVDCSFLLALTSDVTHASLPSSAEVTRIQVNDTASETSVEALNAQIAFELLKPMIPFIMSRIENDTTFHTTEQAITHMLSVVMKVGGANEQRRALALANDDCEAFWAGSRFSSRRLPIFPLHKYALSEDCTNTPSGLTSHTSVLIQTAMKHGHTILTSNKKSVHSVLRVHDRRLYLTYGGDAVFWLIEGRSLAECLRDPHGLQSV